MSLSDGREMTCTTGYGLIIMCLQKTLFLTNAICSALVTVNAIDICSLSDELAQAV